MIDTEVYDQVLDLRQNKLLDEAFELSLELVKSSPILANLYIACELAVEVCNYNDALKLLKTLVSRSLEQKNDWFLPAAYLLQGFSLAKLGRLDEASSSICMKEVNYDNDIFWLQNHAPINKKSIEFLIGNYKK